MCLSKAKNDNLLVALKVKPGDIQNSRPLENMNACANLHEQLLRYFSVEPSYWLTS